MFPDLQLLMPSADLHSDAFLDIRFEEGKKVVSRGVFFCSFPLRGFFFHATPGG